MGLYKIAEDIELSRVWKLWHVTKLKQLLMISNAIQFPVIAGIEIRPDDQGGFKQITERIS